MLEWIVSRTHSTLDYPTIEELPVFTHMQISFDGELSQTGYAPPPAYVYTPYSQSEEEAGYTWAEDPDTHVWGRVLPIAPKPNLPVVVGNPPTLSPPKTHVLQSVADAWKHRGGKGYQYPTQMFGYKIGEKIQFVAMEKSRASPTQDQWRIIGSHDQYDKLEIRFWIKGEAEADKFINDAVLVEARIRSMQRDPTTGIPIMFVSEPEALFGEEKKPDKEKASLLILPASEPTVH